MSDMAIIETVEGDAKADRERHPFGRPTKRRPPKLFRGDGFDPVGAEIIAISPSLGTYGMGGPGFLGFHIDGGRPPGQRWLVITLRSASSWATLDGALVAEGLSEQEKVAAKGSGRAVCSLAAQLIGSRLVAAACTDAILMFNFERAGVIHHFEIRGDGRDVLPWRGSGKTRGLDASESMRDAVVVSASGYLWTAKSTR